ncbi:phosphotransferase [Nocardioides sp.]|uniref:phosphotransferase family protein n=1 Tax=Nocardioides sp. TaxID=35761 RepID=UPI00261D4F7D|nr:phosphotransferase [Nocardioides sp.]MDI6908187.1 phosphotransferase [Nocardioides sp.]
MIAEPVLLEIDTVVPYLRERNRVYSPDATARQLGGGVSNVVLAIDGPSPLVVKQSLPRLRVEASWSAPQDRILTEAEALTLCASMTPARAPRVLDVDPDRFVLCIERAPDDWTDWKTALMSGSVEAGVGLELGRTLGAWHAGTTSGEGITSRMSDPTAFEALRIDPYFRTLASVMPSIGPEVERVISRLSSRRRCLVHGDFSPKNVLVSPDATSILVIDFEVAHLGDPEFDLAFLLSHLTLKAIHLAAEAERIDALSGAFLDAYVGAVPDDLHPDCAWLLRHVGALLLARVHGKSPAEYLSDAERGHAESLGTALLRGQGDSLSSLSALRRKTRP